MNDTDCDLRGIWDRQRDFNERFFKDGRSDLSKLSPADRVRWTKEFVLHVEGELHELLGETSWRMHRAPDDEVLRSNVLEEWVDCFKFLMGLGQVWGFSAEDVVEEFNRKSAVVEYRYAMERRLSLITPNDPVVAVDIDGVLNTYPEDFLSWCAARGRGVGAHDLDCSSLASIREYDGASSYRRLKDTYRESGAKRTQTVRPGAKELLDGLRAAGASVVLLSKRPYWRFYRIYADTLEWMKTNQLRADAVLFHREKHRKILESFPTLRVMVEDDPTVAAEVRAAGYRVILVRAELNRGVEDVDLVESPADALSKILEEGLV